MSPYPGRCRAVAIAAVVAACASFGGCRSVLAPTYEYDEDIHLSLDGSATVYLSASVPALVALRGVDLSVDPRARLDRQAVRALYESPVSHVASVSASRREGRRYVHLRIEVPDIRRLSQSPLFAWSTYAMDARGAMLVYVQTLGASAGRDVGDVGWRGDERIAVRLHLPSRVIFHNQPEHEIQRGNIIAWEQPLRARLAGEPLVIEAHMDKDSILFETLGLFGAMIVLVILTFAAVIWLVMRKGAGGRQAG